MISVATGVKLYLYSLPVDMRKSINGLSMLVAEELTSNPSNGDVYIFRNRANDKVKLLYWDRNGFILHYKRLCKRKFKWPKALESTTIEIDEKQLSWLLAGLDFLLMNEFSQLDYSHYF